MKFIRGLFQIMQSSNEHLAFVSVCNNNSLIRFFFQIQIELPFKTKSSEDIIKYITNCQEALIKINETHKLGAEPQFVKNGKTSKNKKYISENKTQ